MEADEKSAYYNVQVGWAPTWRISKRNSTDNASWVPNMEADEKVNFQYQNIKTLTKNMQTITST